MELVVTFFQKNLQLSFYQLSLPYPIQHTVRENKEGRDSVTAQVNKYAMPLNWDLTEVKDWGELFSPTDKEGYQKMLHVPETIITLTMAVGMREITEKNWERFYGRVRLLERIHGAFFYRDKQPAYITEEDIKRMIGLHTNSSTLTRAQFLKRHTQSLKL